MESHKNRNVTTGQLVEVYYNLHKHRFSIRDRQTKLVLGHADTVTLERVSFHVGAGKERVRQEKKKNVHAFALGSYVGTGLDKDDFLSLHPASYNPYINDTFVDVQTNEPVLDSPFVHCQQTHVYYQKKE